MDLENSLGRLRGYNVGMGLLHAIQGIAVVALSNDFALPVTGTFMEGPPGTTGDTRELFTLPLGPAVAAFLFMSAAAHLLVAGPAWAWYRRNLLEKRSYARWIEYSFSSSLMIVLIAMITGIADVAALVALFGVNASMILFGLLQEHYERPGRPGWLPFVFGCIAGAVPWIAIGIYLWAPGSSAEPPGLRVRDFRVALRVLQLIRAQHGPSVPRDRPVAELPVRRVRVRRAQPRREVGACLAGLREHPRAGLSAPRLIDHCRAGA